MLSRNALRGVLLFNVGKRRLVAYKRRLLLFFLFGVRIIIQFERRMLCVKETLGT